MGNIHHQQQQQKKKKKKNPSSKAVFGSPVVFVLATMSVVQFVARQSWRCSGFRPPSGRLYPPQPPSRPRSVQMTTTLYSSYRGSTHPRTSVWSRTRIRGQATAALYSTKNDTASTNETAFSTTTTEIGLDRDTRLVYEQFRNLAMEIRKHDELYYGGEPVLSDDEFDALVRKEQELEAKHPDLLAIWQKESGLGRAATRRGRVGAATVGAFHEKEEPSSSSSGSTATATTKTANPNPTSARLKRKHLVPMLSLDNVFSEEDLIAWLKKVVKAAGSSSSSVWLDNDTPPTSSTVTIVTEPKLDGVSLSLRYEVVPLTETNDSADGEIPTRRLELQWASTRGDGTIGQDVTAAARQIPGIPHAIELASMDSEDGGGSFCHHQAKALEVRGEVVLPRSEFLRLKKAEEELEASRKAAIEEDSLPAEADATTSNITHSTNETDNNNIDTTNVDQDASSLKDGPPVAAAVAATATAIASFSNPRNAASGLLLRKETDDPEERASSNELRSLLRFYAYDLAILPNDDEQGGGGARPEMDGIQLRRWLSDWNFPLALPVETTTIEWKNRPDGIPASTDDSNDGDESSSSSSAAAQESWDEWFEQTISKSQIKPILEYFSALEQHRERLRKDYNEEVDPFSRDFQPFSATRGDNEASRRGYEWGDFEVDGCVHKVAGASLRAAMGYTTRSPRWAMAHKFPAQSSVTRLLDIVVQVGRTGALTPVAVLEPTEVGGVTVQRATLHNFGHLRDVLGSGSGSDSDDGDGDGDGDSEHSARIPRFEPVLIQRAGDVIPQVVRRIRSGRNSAAAATGDDGNSAFISLEPPRQCPSCASPVIYETVQSSSSLSSVGQVVRCGGPALLCPPRAVTSLKHAFSRDALDLTGLSEARIGQLREADLLTVPSDLFEMDDEGWKTIADLPGWGEKSCLNLRTVCETVAFRGITLGRFVHSLGIRHVGKHTSELVASRYGSVGAFLGALDGAAALPQPPDATTRGFRDGDSDDDGGGPIADPMPPRHPFPELEDAPGIGPVAIESLLAYAKTEELLEATRSLAESLMIREQNVIIAAEVDDDDDTKDSTQPWRGFRVVFTGSIGGSSGGLPSLTRSRAQEIAKKLGATATPGSVSRSTDLVVFGEKGGKKLTQARKLGVATMEASDFIRLATEHGLTDADEAMDDG